MTRSLTRSDIDRIQREVHNLITRGVVTSSDDARMMQEIGIRLQDGHRPQKVEHWHPYGFTHVLHPDAEIIAMAVNGDRDHVVVLPGADRRYRLKGLAEGELAVHDDQDQKVHFTRNGLVIESALGIKIKGPVTVEGDITQTGSLSSTGVHHAGGGHT